MKVVRISSKKERTGAVICGDKDLTSLDLYERVLGENGYLVRTCSTGLDIIAEIDANPVDLVILGLSLSGSSSVSLCKMVKQRSDNKIPVIVVAEPRDEDSIVSALEDGADDYMLKPIKINELATKVGVTLSKNRIQVPDKKDRRPSRAFVKDKTRVPVGKDRQHAGVPVKNEPHVPKRKDPRAEVTSAESKPLKNEHEKPRPLPQIKMMPLTNTALAAMTEITAETEEIRKTGETEKTREADLFAGVYEIIEKVGEGSYSAVYHAIDRTKENPIDVALKVFELDSYKQVEASTHSFLLREAYEMSKLDHENIVKMLDFGKFGQTYYMVMELIRGGSLEQMVHTTGALGEDNLIYIAYQGASVLAYLEKQNLVHRDIKPENMLVNEEGDIKFTDFGLARHCADNALTQKNQQFMGTPQFVSPEQIMPDQDIDIRCDIYSLGATLYFCGTNTLPYAGNNVVEVLMNNLNTTPTPMNKINPAISDIFSDLVVKLMAKQKEERLSPSELKGRLKILLTQYQ